jgi:excisionase family DNA binding protein
MAHQFTPRQIAKALKVSESSVKRWCDSGQIETIRTVGGHRRILHSALMSFLRTTDRELLAPQVLGLDLPTDLASLSIGEEQALDQNIEDEIISSFRAAILSGDESNCRKLVGRWFSLQQSFAPLADRLISTTFHYMGDLWKSDEIEIYQERRAREICTRIILEVRRLIAEPTTDAPLAMGGGPAGDQYTLPSQLIDVVLRQANWHTTNLGSNLPFRTMLAAIRESRPNLFWLSVSSIEDTDRFLSGFNQFAGEIPAGVSLIVGGRALTDQLRPKMTYTAHCDNMQQLAAFARAAHGFGGSAKS